MAVELLRSWAVAVGIEGVSMYAYDFAITELKKQSFMVGLIKTLKHYTDSVLAIAVSAISIAVASARMPEFAVRAVRVIGSYGVKKVLDIVTRRAPSVVLTATNTIEAVNLDPNANVEVWVDGTKQSFQTAPTTDANGNVTITLSTALSAGVHKVLVHSGFKATYTEQYIS